RLVLRVRLAGEDELHRTRRVAEEARDALDVGEQKRRALVGREPSREADGERARVEHLVARGDLFARLAATLGRRAQPAPAKLHQSVAAMLVHLPELGVGDFVDARPEVLVVRRLAPARAEVAVEE